MKFRIWFFFTLFTVVLCDVSISKPNKGQTFTVSGGSVTIDLTWIESNATPKLTAITSYSFTLCTGPNSEIYGFDSSLKKISASDISGYSYSFQVPSTLGADGVYYVQIYATSSDGYTIHYSNRFTLSGMTGSTEPSGDDTSPPSAQTSLSDGATTLPASELSKSFALAYSEQTGLTRYAPMQTQPGTTVTATTWSRRYPASAVTYYTSLSSSLAQLSTITPGWSYTLSSAVNWASAAPFPSENGGWYNPSSKLTKPSVTALSTA
jgi:hypothetical protein